MLAAGVLAGLHHQGSVGRQHPFAIAQRMFDQRRCAKIGKNLRTSDKALTIERMAERGSSQDYLLRCSATIEHG
jgi:hypothetical protein